MPARVHPRLHLDIGWRDLWFAMTASGETLQPEPNLRTTENAFPSRPCIVALSVRTAFLALLQAMKPARGGEVIMSAVNIENMADIVRACGLVPVPVDIDLDTLAPTPEAVRERITEKTVLYLHAHLYGSRNSLASMAKVCRNILLVEDCAQAYDGAAWSGSPEADVSFFSFGPIKPTTTLGGAVVRIRDDDRCAKLSAELANWPEQDDDAIVRRARKLTILKLLSSPLLYGGVLGAMKLRGADTDAVIGAAARGFRPGDLLEQIMKRPSPRLLAIMARRLANPPANAWRRTRAADLRNALRADIHTPGSFAAEHAYWLYPILVPNPGEVIDALRREGFDATRGATSMRVIAGGQTPNAERLIREVVYLPLSPRLTLRDIARMAGTVNSMVAVQHVEAA